MGRLRRCPNTCPRFTQWHEGSAADVKVDILDLRLDSIVTPLSARYHCGHNPWMSLTPHVLSRYSKSDGEYDNSEEILHQQWKDSSCAKRGVLRDHPNSLRTHPSLPNEILCRIFLESSGLDPGAPTTISHVCRSWRQIALDYCGLWTKIELRAKETRMDRASAWADRAGRLSISLGIRYSEDTDLGSIMAWLRDKAHRIKSVSIMHLSRDEKNPLLSSLPPFKQLESFQIVGMEELDLDMRSIAQMLEGSPRLSSLSLSGVSGLHFHESLANTAGHIRHLSIGANSYIDYAFPLRIDAVLDVISACNGLVSLECHALGTEDDHDPQIVSLPSLLSLTIGDGIETCLILKYLHASKLQTLSLVRGTHLDEAEDVVEMPDMVFDRSGYNDLFVDCIRSLHETCSPPVTTIVWDGVNVDINVLQQCSPYLRGMEELRCNRIGSIPLSILSWETGGSRRLFPCLRRIVLTECTSKTTSLDAIHRIINQNGVVPGLRREQLIVEDGDAITVYLKAT